MDSIIYGCRFEPNLMGLAILIAVMIIPFQFVLLEVILIFHNIQMADHSNWCFFFLRTY